jgi:hypothetical protein
MIACPDCGGRKERRVYDPDQPTNLPELELCPTCDGTGEIAEPAAKKSK